MLSLLDYWVRGNHCHWLYPAFQSQLDVTSARSSLETLLPNPQYSKRLKRSKGHQHTVPQRCPPQHGREAPTSRREACPFPLLLVSNCKSVSSDPVRSCNIIVGRRGLLGLLPGPAEEAFISYLPAGHRKAKSPFLFTPFPMSDAQLPIQSWVACAIPCCLFKLPPVVYTTSCNYS